MEVSRDYVRTDYVEEFPVNDRFLKLPVNKFLGLKGVEPIEPQTAIINAINDPSHRFVTACLSRRTGKTFIANHLAFLKAMEPGSSVLIVSPNYSLTGISWNIQCSILAEYGIEIKSKNKTDKEIHLENGSMIKFGSVKQADSLVGRSYDFILFDECALDKDGGDAFNIQLRPTLDKANSKALFISTPRGLNWYYHYYNRGFDLNDSGAEVTFPQWVSIHSTWRDNPRNNAADIEEARKGMSAAFFKQEYEADFATFEGQIYEAFTEEMVQELDHGIFQDRGRYETIMGIDPGYKDSTAAVVVKYDTRGDKFYILEDYNNAENTTNKHAEKFNEMFLRWDVEMLFVDSAAAQFRQDLAVMFDLPSTKANKSVLDGIAYVQGLIENGKLIVDSSCEHVILMMYNYRWDPNEALIKPKPIHDAMSHIADALRYALYSYRI